MRKTAVILFILFLMSGCGTSVDKQDTELLNTPMPTQTIQTPTPTPITEITTDYNEISHKGYGWGFVRKKGSPPQITLEEQQRLSEYGGYYLGKTSEKNIYLTFDEGYENGYTSVILDVLAKHNVKAAFFVTMPYLEGQQALVGRMIDEGHIVGNHTVHHPNLSECNIDEIKQELDILNAKSVELYGYEMKYMRPPEGAYSERVLAIARDMGYKTIFWSHAYKDWDVNMQKGKEYAINQVVPYFHDGEILLLHAVSKDNADALEEIILKAQESGFAFKSLDEL